VDVSKLAAHIIRRASLVEDLRARNARCTQMAAAERAELCATYARCTRMAAAAMAVFLAASDGGTHTVSNQPYNRRRRVAGIDDGGTDDVGNDGGGWP